MEQSSKQRALLIKVATDILMKTRKKLRQDHPLLFHRIERLMDKPEQSKTEESPCFEKNKQIVLKYLELRNQDTRQ